MAWNTLTVELREYGIVHRDIEPDNIVITSNEVTILDWVSVKISDRDNAYAGTSGYSPSKEVTEKYNEYSLW